MHDAITKLLATPEGQAYLAGLTSLGLVLLTEIIKWLYSKQSSNKLAKEVIYLVTFIFANLATLSATALNYLPLLKGTRYEQITFGLTGLAIGIHSLATSKVFTKAASTWSDFKDFKATTKPVQAGFAPVVDIPEVPPLSAASAAQPSTPPLIQ